MLSAVLQLAGYHVPELMHLVKPMLHEDPDQRPSIRSVLHAFDRMVRVIGEHRMRSTCTNGH